MVDSNDQFSNPSVIDSPLPQIHLHLYYHRFSRHS